MLVTFCFTRFNVLSPEDPCLSESQFLSLVDDLVNLFNLLPWLWLQTPGIELRHVVNIMQNTEQHIIIFLGRNFVLYVIYSI